jgi:hypothetical protein
MKGKGVVGCEEQHPACVTRSASVRLEKCFGQFLEFAAAAFLCRAWPSAQVLNRQTRKGHFIEEIVALNNPIQSVRHDKSCNSSPGLPDLEQSYFPFTF